MATRIDEDLVRENRALKLLLEAIEKQDKPKGKGAAA